MTNGLNNVRVPVWLMRWLLGAFLVLISAGVGHLYGQVEDVRQSTDRQMRDLRQGQSEVKERLGKVEGRLDAVKEQGRDTNQRVQNVERLLMRSRRGNPE